MIGGQTGVSIDCMSNVISTFSTVWINRVRLPRSWSAEQGKRFPTSPFAHEILLTRDRFGRPFPRQPAHSSMNIRSAKLVLVPLLTLWWLCIETHATVGMITITPAQALKREEPGTIYMYVMAAYVAIVWINRVRLPVLLVVSWTGKRNMSLSSAFAPENLVSRDGFCCSVPRQSAHLHTQAESGAYILRDSSRLPRRRPFIYLKPPYAIESVPCLSGHAIAYRWRLLPRVRWHRASKPQGSSEGVLP